MCWLLWHDVFAGPAHITADGSGLGTEQKCCCFTGMRACACACGPGLVACSVVYAVPTWNPFHVYSLSRIKVRGKVWHCATSHSKWCQCVLQLSLRSWYKGKAWEKQSPDFWHHKWVFTYRKLLGVRNGFIHQFQQVLLVSCRLGAVPFACVCLLLWCAISPGKNPQTNREKQCA